MTTRKVQSAAIQSQWLSQPHFVFPHKAAGFDIGWVAALKSVERGFSLPTLDSSARVHLPERKLNTANVCTQEHVELAVLGLDTFYARQASPGWLGK